MDVELLNQSILIEHNKFWYDDKKEKLQGKLPFINQSDSIGYF